MRFRISSTELFFAILKSLTEIIHNLPYPSNSGIGTGLGHYPADCLHDVT